MVNGPVGAHPRHARIECGARVRRLQPPLRNDERVNFSLTEKVPLRPAGGRDGALMPAAWHLDHIDKATEQRIAEIVRAATC